MSRTLSPRNSSREYPYSAIAAALTSRKRSVTTVVDHHRGGVHLEEDAVLIDRFVTPRFRPNEVGRFTGRQAVRCAIGPRGGREFHLGWIRRSQLAVFSPKRLKSRNSATNGQLTAPRQSQLFRRAR